MEEENKVLAVYLNIDAPGIAKMSEEEREKQEPQLNIFPSTSTFQVSEGFLYIDGPEGHSQEDSVAVFSPGTWLYARWVKVSPEQKGLPN